MNTPQSRRWYLAKKKQRVGPFTTEQLRQMLSAGMIQHTDMLLEEGQPRWQEAGTIEGIWSQAEPLVANPPSKSNAEGRYPVLQPGEDFFLKSEPPDGDPNELPEVSDGFSENVPTPNSKLLLGAALGAFCPTLLCCLIVLAVDANLVVGLVSPFVVMVFGGLVGAVIGRLVLYPYALKAFHQAVEARKAWEQAEGQRLAQGTQCPSCGRDFSRIGLVRGTILSGPVEIRPVLRTHRTIRTVSHPYELSREHYEKTTGTEQAPTRKSCLVSVYKCKFCGHIWEDRLPSRENQEIDTDGSPLPSFACESLLNAVSRRLRG